MDVAILGIDGLDPTLVREWRDELPNLAGLVDDGGFGELQSSHPPLTAPAWPTMYTGKQGGKHGVFSFTREAEGTYDQRPINFGDVHAEALWEVLDDAGVATGVVNVPMTYPPSEMDEGFVVAGWPVPSRTEVASDAEVVEQLENALGERYRVNPFPLTAEFRQFSNERLFEEISEGLDHHRRAFRTLLEQHGDQLDVFFSVFMAIDIASHNFSWDRDYLRRLYVRQDEALGELLDELPEETNVILLSDHGHGVKGKWSFHVNEWLGDEGYLRRGKSVNTHSVFQRVGFTVENVVRVKNWLGFGDIQERLPPRLLEWVKANVPAGSDQTREFQPSLVEWSDTEAYSAQQNLITLNTADKPEGIVTEAEYEAVLSDLVDDLQSLDHPDPGADRQLVSDLYRKDQIFEGPFYSEAPDVVFLADDMQCNAPMGFADGVFADERWGEHRKVGVLVTSGPAFSHLDGEADQDDIKDVFPTVLGLVNVPIPENVDGEIASQRFEDAPAPEFRESRDEAGDIAAYSDTETEAVEEQLEAMGYLE